jgi:hypothetical protein
MTTSIALADGDVRWVFPDLVNPDEVQALLREASARIGALAGHLGVRPSWTGSGLEYEKGDRARASLFGCAEVPEASFIVTMTDSHASVWETDPLAFRWELDAEVAVRCDHVADCGMHTIEEKNTSFDDPTDAARGLVEAATWLLERGTAEPLHSWRERDTQPGQRRTVR